MERDSAMELRNRWLSRLRAQRVGSAAPAAPADDFGAPADVPQLPRVAIGITGLSGNYRPAIRLQDATAATHLAAAAMSKEAFGEVDVLHIGEVRGLLLRTRPLMAGVSVGNRLGIPGTLGCLVRKRGAAAPRFVLSNNHVLARINFAQPDEVIVQPAAGEQTGDGPFEIGLFNEAVALAAAGNLVDAAIAAVDSTVDCDDTAIFGITTRFAGERTADLVQGEPVFKVGRTTGKTTGTIKAWGISVLSVKLGAKLLDFDDQIEVLPDGAQFCDDGDSGSVVVDGANRVAGLLFSKSLATEMAYANWIEHVFSGLDVELA